MEYGVLYLPPERHNRNAVTGQYLKGHTPHNKGKRWSDYMDEEGIENCKKGWKNLEEHRPKHRAKYCGKPKRKVVAVFDDGEWSDFDDIHSAGFLFGIRQENVRRCCKLNQERHINKKTGKVNTDHKYKGIRFYFDEDRIWTTKIK